MATSRFLFHSDSPNTVDAQVQNSLGQALKNNGQFTIIADVGGTSHNVNDGNISANPHNVLSFLARPATMSTLVRNGVKILAIEERHEFQPLVDQVMAGKMTPQQFAMAKANMYRASGDVAGSTPSPRWIIEAQVFQQAAKSGIKVFCAESQEANLKQHAASVDYIASVQSNYMRLRTAGARAGDLGSAIMMRIERGISHSTNGFIFPNAEQESAVVAGEQSIRNMSTVAGGIAIEHKKAVEIRLRGDKDLAERIKKFAQGQKTVVFYGNEHGAFPRTLSDHLGNAPKIAIHPSRDDLAWATQFEAMERMKLPTFAITLDKGTLFSPNDIAKLVVTSAKVPKRFTPNP